MSAALLAVFLVGHVLITAGLFMLLLARVGRLEGALELIAQELQTLQQSAQRGGAIGRLEK